MPRATPLAVLLLSLSLMGCDRPAETESPTAPEEAESPAVDEGTQPTTAASPAPAETPAPAPATSNPKKTAPAPAQPSPPAPVPAPAEPEISLFTVPAGTELGVSLATALNSGTNQVGNRFTGSVTQPIIVDGVTLIPVGSKVHGVVEAVTSAKKGRGNASLQLRFDQLELPDGSTAEFKASVSGETDGTKKRNAAIIGGSAAGGAILGRVIGNDTKDAAIGAIVGGAIATGVVFSRKGDQVDLPAGTELTLKIDEPMQLRIAEGS